MRGKVASETKDNQGRVLSEPLVEEFDNVEIDTEEG